MKHISDEEMFRLIDGECPAEEAQAFQTHLHHCDTCKKMHAEISLLELRMHQLILDKPSVDFTEQVIKKLQSAPSLQLRSFSPKQLSLSLAPIAILFALILVLFSGISLGWFMNPTPVISNTISKTYDLTLSPSILQNEWVTLIFLIAISILLLLILDKALLKPYFRKKFEQPAG